MIQFVKTKKGKCEVSCDKDDEPPATTVSAHCPYFSLHIWLKYTLNCNFSLPQFFFPKT